MKKGYTLVEMVIVIAIFVIIFGAGYANLRSYAQRQRFNSFVNDIRNDVVKAHENAVAGNKPAGCVGTFNGYEIHVMSNTQYEIVALCSSSSPQLKLSVPDIGGLLISTPNPNPIIFKSLAQGTNIPAGATASITVSYPGATYTRSVTVGSNGNIQ